jgi:hypothetical protein
VSARACAGHPSIVVPRPSLVWRRGKRRPPPPSRTQLRGAHQQLVLGAVGFVVDDPHTERSRRARRAGQWDRRSVPGAALVAVLCMRKHGGMARSDEQTAQTRDAPTVQRSSGRRRDWLARESHAPFETRACTHATALGSACGPQLSGQRQSVDRLRDLRFKDNELTTYDATFCHFMTNSARPVCFL